MLIQFHILQNYGPSNLNRDQSGRPKTAVLGGHLRSRISSQCLKRSIRQSDSFAPFAQAELLGIRTVQLPSLIGQELASLGADAKTIRAITQRVPEIGRKMDSKKPPSTTRKENTTKQLLFVSRQEVRDLAKQLLELYQSAKSRWTTIQLEQELGGSIPVAVDIALTGRMTTSSILTDVTCAMQMAHAISTNRVVEEFDYFTAIDDLNPNANAAMLGEGMFNSSTYYKYLNVHWEQLVENLRGDMVLAQLVVSALIEAIAIAHPSGKQNSFAAFNLPDVMLIEVSERNLPVSYANAFITPVNPQSGKSPLEISADKMAKYMGQLNQAFGIQSQQGYLSMCDTNFPMAQRIESLEKLQAWVVECIQKGQACATPSS